MEAVIKPIDRELILAELTPDKYIRNTRKGGNGHLGGAVDRHMGCDLAAQLHHAQVLDDEGIHTGGGSMADQITEFFGFPVGNQGIQSQMHLNTPDMAVLDCLRQGLGGKILGALAGIEGAAAQIDRICAILHRSAQGIHRARRG